MKQYFSVILFTFFSLVATIDAQKLTLDQLISKALESNIQVQISQFNESQTNEEINEVKAKARPQVNLAGDYKRYLKIPGQVIDGSAFGGPEGKYQVFAFGLPYNLSTSIQVTQAVYSPSLNIGLKMAKISKEVSQVQTIKSKEEVAYNVSVAFYNLQTVTQQARFLEGNIASLNKMINITDLLYKSQLAQAIDSDRLKITQTQLMTQLESVKSSEKDLVNMLKFLTGMSQSENLIIDVDESNTSIDPTFYVNSPSKHTDLMLLEKQFALNQLNQKNTKATFLPSVSAYGIGNSTFFGQGGENSVFKQAPGYWLGLQVNWNIYDGSARKSKLAHQKLESQKLAAQTFQAREAIQMSTDNSSRKYIIEKSNIETSKAQVALAEKVYTQTQLQFKEGISGLTEVIQAENTVREAQNNYLNALVNLRSAELDWKKSSGHLLN